MAEISFHKMKQYQSHDLWRNKVDRETPTSNYLQLLDHFLSVGQLTLHLILKII